MFLIFKCSLSQPAILGSTKAKKRQFNEVDKLDDLTKPICNATLHGIVASVSPLKKGHTCNFFEGFITDGSSKVVR